MTLEQDMAGLLDPDAQLCALRGVSGSLEPLCGRHHAPGPGPAAAAGPRLSRKGSLVPHVYSPESLSRSHGENGITSRTMSLWRSVEWF